MNRNRLVDVQDAWQVVLPCLAEKDLLCDLSPRVFFCPVWVKIITTLFIRQESKMNNLMRSRMMIDLGGELGKAQLLHVIYLIATITIGTNDEKET